MNVFDIVGSVLNSLHFDKVLFWTQFCMFFVLHYFMKFAFYDEMLKVRGERDKKIGGRLAEAEKVAAEARALKDRYEESLRQARLQAQVLLQQATVEAEKHKAEKVAAARESARNLADSVQRSVNDERQAAMASLEGDIRDLSVSIVDRLLRGLLADPEREKVMVRVRSAS